LIEDIYFDASHFELVFKNLDVIIIKVAKKTHGTSENFVCGLNFKNMGLILVKDQGHGLTRYFVEYPMS
jgi:hypothetical protein